MATASVIRFPVDHPEAAEFLRVACSAINEASRRIGDHPSALSNRLHLSNALAHIRKVQASLNSNNCPPGVPAGRTQYKP